MPDMPGEAEVAEALYHYITPALTLVNVPVFGTAEWVALPDDDERKQAAVIRAAMLTWGARLAAQDTHIEASNAIAEYETERRRELAQRRWRRGAVR